MFNSHVNMRALAGSLRVLTSRRTKPDVPLRTFNGSPAMPCCEK
jgi:hypothetical protein